MSRPPNPGGRAALDRPARPVRRAARRASDRWTHLWERLSIEFDDFTDEVRILRLHLPSPADGVAEHRRSRRRGAGARTARRGVSRPRVLGRAVRLPGPQPAAARDHPVAAGLPLPATAGGPHAARDGRLRGRDVSRGRAAATAARRANGSTSIRASGRWMPDASARAPTSASPSPTTCGSTTRSPATSSS